MTTSTTPPTDVTRERLQACLERLGLRYITPSDESNTTDILTNVNGTDVELSLASNFVIDISFIIDNSLDPSRYEDALSWANRFHQATHFVACAVYSRDDQPVAVTGSVPVFASPTLSENQMDAYIGDALRMAVKTVQDYRRVFDPEHTN